jgi:hypothetical protein
MKRVSVALASALLIAASPPAHADPGPGNGGSGVGGGGRDFDMDVGLPSGGMVLILCPGVGAGANVLAGLGAGGWCDYGFSPGGAHIACRWGGSGPFLAIWECHRVFKGQEDWPAIPLADPDIRAPGSGPAPDALWGPSPDDQAPHEPPLPPETPAPEIELPGQPPLLPAIGSR